MIKAVLFDLDDTLLKTIEAKWAHHKAVAKQVYNVDLSDETLALHWGKPITEMMSYFYETNDPADVMLAHNRKLDPQFPKGVYEDALTTVTTLLDAGMEVGIVTSTMTEWAKADLMRLGFPVERLFIIQGEDQHDARKPDPAVFDPALKLLTDKGITHDQVAYVGDSLFDLRAALGANLRFIGVTTGLISAAVMHSEGAVSVVEHLSGLLPLVAN